MTAELELVAACCRWPDEEDRRSRIIRLSDGISRWEKVIGLAEAHRVVPLVSHGLQRAGTSLPTTLARQLQDRRDALRVQALTQAAKTLDLSRAFTAAGIEHRILKGVPLGVLAYGTPLLKQSWDIDLLVEPASAVESVSLLRELGYEPLPPAATFSGADFKRWAAVTKELILQSADGTVVELHWGISDHPMLLAGLGAKSPPPLDVPILGSATVPTFALEPNLAYLAVHGAFHGWSRLKWLADFAALFASAGDAQGVLKGARFHEPGLALDQAIILSNQLLGTSAGPTDERQHLPELVKLARDVIGARVPDREIELDSSSQRFIRRSQWLLLPSWRYRALLALRWARGSEDRKRVALPALFSWIYWIARPFSGLARTAVRRIAGHKDRKRL